MIDFRKLAALDIAFLGRKVIICEFATGVIGAIGLGVLTLMKTESAKGRWLGAYLIGVGINYVPLLVYAIQIDTREIARTEIADEPGDTRALFRKYRRLSFLLLVPFVVPSHVWFQRAWRSR